MKSRALLVPALLIFTFGCNKEGVRDHTPQPVIRILHPVPPDEPPEPLENLRQYSFGGLYAITSCDRYGLAAQLAERRKSEITKYMDGGITASIYPVPYGFRLRLVNHVAESLTIVGPHCAIIDIANRSHDVELRRPTSLYPAETPEIQTITVPPGATVETTLDVILPLHRRQILLQSRSPEERGASVTTDAPLPVFCSGYFLFEKHQPKVEQVRRWAMGREFKVYLELEGTRGRYCYLFVIEPFRFTTGPEPDPSWELPYLTPPAIESR